MHDKLFEDPDFQREYDIWTANTFVKEKTFMDKRPLMVRIAFLEKKVEELCQQIEKLSLTEQED